MPRLNSNVFSQLNGVNGITITDLPPNQSFSFATGDFNGDGIDDLAIGNSQSNSAYLILGPLNATTTTTTGSVAFDTLIDGVKGFQVRSSKSDDDLGSSVALLDINGDSKKDLIITSTISSSQSYLAVIFGAAGPYAPSLDVYDDETFGSLGIIIYGVSNDRMGYSVTGGDVNGDDVEDIVVSASIGGSTYVIFGNRNTTSLPSSVTSLNGENGFHIKTAVSSLAVSDIDQDGCDDVLINTGGGTHYVLFGAEEFPPSVSVTSFNGMSGFSITARFDIGFEQLMASSDINGDGYPDVLIGSPAGLTGKIYCVFGAVRPFPVNVNVKDLSGINGFEVNGPSTSDHVGNALSAGDINGDGIGDVITGAWGLNDGAGGVSIVYGSRIPFPAHVELENAESTCHGTNLIAKPDSSDSTIGFSTAIGDLNNDGIGDIVTASNRGKVYVVFGLPIEPPSLSSEITTNSNYNVGDTPLVLDPT